MKQFYKATMLLLISFTIFISCTKTVITFKTNYKKSMRSPFKRLAIVIRSSRFKKSISSQAQKFFKLLPIMLKKDLNSEGVDTKVILLTGIELDDTPIATRLKKIKPDTVMFLTATHATLSLDEIITCNFDISLYNQKKQKRFFRSNIIVKKLGDGFSAGGIDDESAITFSKQIVSTLKKQGLLK